MPRESTILNEAYTKYTLSRHEKMLPHQVGKATFKMTKNKERVILDKITKYLKWVGQLGVVVDSAAHYSQGSGRYIKSQTTVGTSDIIACINGKFVSIELKRIYATGKDRQSEEQKKFEQRVNNAGGDYIIVNDFMSFYEWYLKSTNQWVLLGWD